jgi:hypothetical protein
VTIPKLSSREQLYGLWAPDANIIKGFAIGGLGIQGNEVAGVSYSFIGLKTPKKFTGIGTGLIAAGAMEYFEGLGLSVFTLGSRYTFRGL